MFVSVHVTHLHSTIFPVGWSWIQASMKNTLYQLLLLLKQVETVCYSKQSRLARVPADVELGTEVVIREDCGEKKEETG